MNATMLRLAERARKHVMNRAGLRPLCFALLLGSAAVARVTRPPAAKALAQTGDWLASDGTLPPEWQAQPKSFPSNATTLAYDYENRVTSITLPGGTTDTFTYNGVDTRTGKVDSNGTHSYRRDGVDATDPVLNDSAAEYTPGVSESRSSTSKFYHTDRMGTTTKITNSSMSTTDSRQFDAFGMLVSSSGTTPTPFGYAGKLRYQEDSDPGLKLLGHRLYDPSLGRFLVRDSAKDGRNWYSYCNSNPLRYTDPDGRFIVILIMIVAVFALTIENTHEGDESHHDYVLMTNDLSKEKIWQQVTLRALAVLALLFPK